MKLTIFLTGQVLLHLLDKHLTLEFYVECVIADGRLEAATTEARGWTHCLWCCVDTVGAPIRLQKVLLL